MLVGAPFSIACNRRSYQGHAPRWARTVGRKASTGRISNLLPVRKDSGERRASAWCLCIPQLDPRFDHQNPMRSHGRYPAGTQPTESEDMFCDIAHLLSLAADYGTLRGKVTLGEADE